MPFTRDHGRNSSCAGSPHLRRLFAWLLLSLALVGAAGCESPTNFFQTNPPAVDLGDQQSEGEQQAEADPQQDDQPIDVEVRSLEPGADKAQRLLEQNFEGFLSRRPLGFDQRLPELVLDDLEQLGEQAAQTPARFLALSPGEMAQQLLPAVVIAILVVIFALLDRALLRWAKRLQARLHIDLSRNATRFLRALLLVVGRLAPLFVLMLLSYFPVQALAQQAPWSLFLTRALWLGIIYRAIHAVLVVTFSGRFVDVPIAHAQRLETYSVWVTRVIFGFLLALAAIEVFEYHRQAFFFVRFCLKLTVAFVPVYLFFVKPSVMALLPAYAGSRFYTLFRSLIGHYYHWILAATVALLLMRAAGYVKAATFILVRGYAIILLVLLAFVVSNTVRNFLRRRTAAIDAEQKVGERAAETGPPQLAKSLEQLLFVAGALILALVVLDLLGVREAVVALLRTPLVEVGNVSVSLFNLLSVGLIVFGTILAIKILKAFLNAKVYPAFSVDVGVAYALNTLLSYVLVVVGFLVTLAALGVNLSAIAVVLASLGVGIGFGLQTLTENLISGFIILFGRSVKKGDFITVRDTYGRVEAVGARSVVIRTPDNYDMLIPSKEIVGGQITNWTFRDGRIRMHIDIGVSYNANPAEVKEVLIGVAERSEMVLETPDPEVWLVGFGDNSIDFQLLVHFDCREYSPARLKGLLNFDIWQALHDADIEIPFPQRDLHIRSGEILPEVAKMLREYRQAAGRGQAGDKAEDGHLLAPPVDMSGPRGEDVEDEEDKKDR